MAKRKPHSSVAGTQADTGGSGTGKNQNRPELQTYEYALWVQPTTSHNSNNNNENKQQQSQINEGDCNNDVCIELPGSVFPSCNKSALWRQRRRRRRRWCWWCTSTSSNGNSKQSHAHKLRYKLYLVTICKLQTESRVELGCDESKSKSQSHAMGQGLVAAGRGGSGCCACWSAVFICLPVVVAVIVAAVTDESIWEAERLSRWVLLLLKTFCLRWQRVVCAIYTKASNLQWQLLRLLLATVLANSPNSLAKLAADWLPTANCQVATGDRWSAANLMRLLTPIAQDVWPLAIWPTVAFNVQFVMLHPTANWCPRLEWKINLSPLVRTNFN